ncbi:hypothetical protein BJY52DRAFT_1294361, partial [Lactarius psammicola]
MCVDPVQTISGWLCVLITVMSQFLFTLGYVPRSSKSVPTPTSQGRCTHTPPTSLPRLPLIPHISGLGRPYLLL